MAAADRPPGSGRGRVGCDWEQAFVYWTELPPEQRSYAAVAAEFKLSVRTVERHGREDGWQRRLQQINQLAAADTDGRLAQEKAERTARLRRLLDATLVGYAENLRDRQIRMTPSDLDRVYKLWRLLEDEHETPTNPTAPAPASAPHRADAHIEEVVKALAEIGALADLGLELTEAPNDPEINPTTDQEEEID